MGLDKCIPDNQWMYVGRMTSFTPLEGYSINRGALTIRLTVDGTENGAVWARKIASLLNEDQNRSVSNMAGELKTRLMLKAERVDVLIAALEEMSRDNYEEGAGETALMVVVKDEVKGLKSLIQELPL